MLNRCSLEWGGGGSDGSLKSYLQGTLTVKSNNVLKLHGHICFVDKRKSPETNRHAQQLITLTRSTTSTQDTKGHFFFFFLWSWSKQTYKHCMSRRPRETTPQPPEKEKKSSSAKKQKQKLSIDINSHSNTTLPILMLLVKNLDYSKLVAASQ